MRVELVEIAVHELNYTSAHSREMVRYLLDELVFEFIGHLQGCVSNYLRSSAFLVCAHHMTVATFREPLL